MLISRRHFLEAIGLVGASTLVSSCTGAPMEKLYAYLTPEETLIPGVAAYYASVCRACPAGCGLLVKTREARPIKLEGNPAHPINRGALCPRGQASIQGLYGQGRVSTPLLRKEGRLVEASWDEALNRVMERLVSARSVAILSGLESGSLADLYREFLQLFEHSRLLFYEPLAPVALRAASRVLFGLDEVPRINLERAGQVLSLGADLFDTFVSPVEYASQWATRHGVERHGAAIRRSMFMDYVGPRRNLTANAADHWHRIPPSAFDSLSLALAYNLFELRRDSLTEDETAQLEATLRALGPRPADIALEGTDLQQLARKCHQAKNAVVLAGVNEMQASAQTRTQVAALLCNYLLGGIGTSLRYGEEYAYSRCASEGEVLDFMNEAVNFDALFVIGTNPAYSLPGGRIAEGLERARFLVSLAWELDETTQVADVVLPVHHPLESWGDYEVSREVRGLMQPVRSPLYDSRHPGDLLLQLAGPRGPSARDFKEYLVSRWSRTLENGITTEAWEQMLVEGGVFRPTQGEQGNVITGTVRQSILATAPQTLAALPQRAGSEGHCLLVTSSAAFYDGRSASNEWLQENPDALTQTSWEVPLEVSREIAQQKGITTGDQVAVRCGARDLLATALVTADLAPDAVSLRMGGGRKVGARQLPGANVMQFLDTRRCPLSGQADRLVPDIELTRIDEDLLVSVSGSQNTEDRFLALSMGLEDFQHGRFPKLTRHGDQPVEGSSVDNHRDGGGRADPGHETAEDLEDLPMPYTEKGGSHPDDNMVPLQQHPAHRWGLVVDLDLCIGCGACAIACQAENNIPVVGRDEVSRGRELFWIRIEKHVFGDGRDIRFLPVMCQHCDNAPCEPVCPVFASVHTPDGLNAQIYNRCVGTRYCSNNCPYKVRRFNYFDYKRLEPGNQQLNPDVTVRSRGVMEKCTLCIQRIREKTNLAKVEGRDVADGEIVPACAQTCPTGAIVFGDYKRAEWEMSKRARSPRGYRLLDYVANTRPGIVYLRKVYT